MRQTRKNSEERGGAGTDDVKCSLVGVCLPNDCRQASKQADERTSVRAVRVEKVDKCWNIHGQRVIHSRHTRSG